MQLATQDKPFFPEDLVGKFSLARDLGFDAFEVDGSWLLGRAEEVAAAVRATGLPVAAACGGYRGWIGHFDEGLRRVAVEDLRSILGRLGALGGRGVVVPAAWGMFSLRLPPMKPPRSPEADRAALLDSLSSLERAAEAAGTLLFLEPLNRYEDHMLNLLGDAAALIEAGAFHHVRICADFFHMNIEEARIEASLDRHQALLGHVHLADSHRYQPGDGHLDFLPGLRALATQGYDGCLTVECRVRGADPRAAYAASVSHLRSLFAQAGLGA